MSHIRQPKALAQVCARQSSLSMVQYRLTPFGRVMPHRTPSSSLLNLEPSLHPVPHVPPLSPFLVALSAMKFGQSPFGGWSLDLRNILPGR